MEEGVEEGGKKQKEEEHRWAKQHWERHRVNLMSPPLQIVVVVEGGVAPEGLVLPEHMWQ